MIPLDIQPGVKQELSKARHTTNWRQAHLVRWEGSTLLPFNGWEKVVLGPFASDVREIHRWMTNAGNMYTAYLCEAHLYVNSGDQLIDVTPIGGMVVPTGNNAAYGDNVYNFGLYGTPRPGESRLKNYTPTYSLDNWGDELRAMTSADGRLLKWNPATPATRAIAVAGAPIQNRSFVITPERHMMLFGMGGKPDVFGWSDDENDGNWAFTDITSKAGQFDLEPSSPIVAHKQFFDGVIMFTMERAYVVKYSGMPYIYGYFEAGKTPAPVSPLSVAEIPEGVIWPSIDGFWLYTGSAILPVECDIWDWVKKVIDFPNSMFYAYAINIMNKSELWWCFVGLDSQNRRNSMIAVYDYRSKWWSMGKIARSCGFVYSNDRYPIVVDTNRVVWKHETGWNYPGAEMPWVETFTMNLNDGENWMTMNQILPEIVGDNQALKFNVYKQIDRTVEASETMSPDRLVFPNGQGRVQFRETGRDFRLKISMIKPTGWTVGPILYDVKRRGNR
jgi:hypothetical protein